MSKENKTGTAQESKQAPGQESKKAERMAAALRENLKRRKAQAKDRKKPTPDQAQGKS